MWGAMGGRSLRRSPGPEWGPWTPARTPAPSCRLGHQRRSQGSPAHSSCGCSAGKGETTLGSDLGGDRLLGVGGVRRPGGSLRAEPRVLAGPSVMCWGPPGGRSETRRPGALGGGRRKPQLRRRPVTGLRSAALRPVCFQPVTLGKTLYQDRVGPAPGLL